MIKLSCNKVTYGDSFIIQYGDKGDKYIFLDGGFGKNYKNQLRRIIDKMASDGYGIDFWFLSHVHNDHIQAPKEYIRDIERGYLDDIVSKWIYNPLQPNVEVYEYNHSNNSVDVGFDQFDEIEAYVRKVASACQDIISGYSIVDDELVINILSPISSKLQIVRDKYKENGELDLEENDQFKQDVSGAQFDYDICLDEFDTTKSYSDDSLENQACISAIFQSGSASVLWCADANSDTIANSLKNMGYSSDNPLNCSCFIVGHHGSRYGNLSSLIELVKCTYFVVSADGSNSYALPTKEVMARILRSPNRNEKKIHIHFCGESYNLEHMFDVDSDDVYEEYNFEVSFQVEKEYSISFT